MERMDDNALIDAYARGIEPAFAKLVERHLPLVYNFVLRYAGDSGDAEDIAQDVFVKMWRNIKKFKKEKNFKVWMLSIAKNTAIDFLRKKKALPFSSFDDIDGEGNALEHLFKDTESLPDIRFDEKLEIGKLRAAFEKLPPLYKLTVVMRFENDLTFEELAEILEEPLNTVKSRYRRALSLLRPELADGTAPKRSRQP